MKIFTLVTPQMAILEQEYFLPTCPSDLEPTVLRGNVSGDYAWGRPGFCDAVRAKLDRLIEVIREHPDEVVIWSDVDIQFFGPCSVILQECMKGRDLMFQSEAWPPNGKVNAGFIVVRCNDRTSSVFQEARCRDFEGFEFHDQTAIQGLLDEKREGLCWGVLPARFWAYSHGGVPPDDIVLHHANMEGVLVKKIEQLKAVRQYVMMRQRYRFVREAIDRVHNSRVAGFLARRIPVRLRSAVRMGVRYDGGLDYRPSCEDWGK